MNLSTAIHLRNLAERNSDPEMYLQAAAAFMNLDMPLAVERCLKRAERYSSLFVLGMGEKGIKWVNVTIRKY